MQSELNLNPASASAPTARCDSPDAVTSLDKLAITNIFTPADGEGSEQPRLWAHLLALWLIALLVLKVQSSSSSVCAILASFVHLTAGS